ncbi:MAG: glutamine synthetase III [Chlamydiota bacterium]
MSTARFHALQEAASRVPTVNEEGYEEMAKRFGVYVFKRSIMERNLPPKVYSNLLDAMASKAKIKAEYADIIAEALKDWAVGLGATHYSHIFHPLTGTTAEKHDAFIEWHTPDNVIASFSGRQLIQGEPDASSFPSGGLRTTYEARGYTGWDPTSLPFVWKAGDGITLCIPSVFFSWTGAVLDNKIPLLRSDNKLDKAMQRLLKLMGLEAGRVYSMLGCEQEYFLVDRALYNLRPDLVILGKTVCGAPPPKGQELGDHYFATVKDRVLSYMCDFENAALELGIPVKTRHNEVAPAQHEIAVMYEKASASIDHNIALMELMGRIAKKHNLKCLLHEKPFAGVNGSGKHNNWSIQTDTGLNLLDPTDTPENSLQFLVALTAVINGIYEHADLLRASAGSASNDERLGGDEAPPAIMSVYLGEALEHLLDNIEHCRQHKSASRCSYDLGVLEIPDVSKDNTDRNRTSPFAFTGNKFEFRAVGSSSSCAFPITVINCIVADSLNKIIDEIEDRMSNNDLTEAVMPVLQKYLKRSRSIRFSGDNYSEQWLQEARKRGLSNFTNSVEAFEVLKNPATVKIFEGILTREELNARYEIFTDAYAKTINIEAKLIEDIARNQLIPAALGYQNKCAKSIKNVGKVIPGEPLEQQKRWLASLVQHISESQLACDKLSEQRTQAHNVFDYCQKVKPLIVELRECLDILEAEVDDALWPLPKYRELLFNV